MLTGLRICHAERAKYAESCQVVSHSTDYEPWVEQIIFQYGLVRIYPWHTNGKVPIFFIIFRECLEASIIVSVLLAFINKSTSQGLPSDNASVEKNAFLRKRLVRQVWFGAGFGLLVRNSNKSNNI